MNKEDLMKLLPVERMAVLQGCVESYLLKTEHKTFAEKFPEIDDIYGALNEKQLEILHLYLEDEYKAVGLDLNQKIIESGSQPVEGGLSDYEKKELVRIADRELALVACILERKERLFKKQK